jgi:hypothetical protein
LALFLLDRELAYSRRDGKHKAAEIVVSWQAKLYTFHENTIVGPGQYRVCSTKEARRHSLRKGRAEFPAACGGSILILRTFWEHFHDNINNPNTTSPCP